LQVLITAGGTREPIDGVRFITNFSTGSTGAYVADYLFANGVDVTLLTSIDGRLPENSLKVIKYSSFEDIEKFLREELGKREYDAVIQMAAISDYSVDYLESGTEIIKANQESKLDSGESLKIVLKKNPKLVNSLKGYSSGNLKVIAFKLTKNGSRELIKEKVNSIFKGGEVDFIVHNDLTSITKDSHITTIYDAKGSILTGKTKRDLGENLKKILLEEI
jgi:phosphopantothenoylcysteine synthetase/decarboxylase